MKVVQRYIATLRASSSIGGNIPHTGAKPPSLYSANTSKYNFSRQQPSSHTSPPPHQAAPLSQKTDPSGHPSSQVARSPAQIPSRQKKHPSFPPRALPRFQCQAPYQPHRHSHVPTRRVRGCMIILSRRTLRRLGRGWSVCLLRRRLFLYRRVPKGSLYEEGVPHQLR